MNDRKLTENIYKLLDGELSHEQQVELEQYIRQDAEAKKRFDECMLMKNQFNNLQRTESEPDLKKEILEKINWNQYAKEGKRMETKVVRSVWQMPVIRTSFIFVCGIFVGLLIFAVFRADFLPVGSNSEGMKGTFAGSTAFDELKVADMLLFEGTEATAVCNVRYSADVVEIHLEVKSEQEVKAMLDFNQAYFSPINIQNVNLNEKASSQTSSNFVYINNTGENKYIVRLFNKDTHPHPISFKLLQAGQQIYQNMITINK